MSDVPDSHAPTPRSGPACDASVSFREAFRFWLKLGFISFGGPAGQIAIMHRELVEKRRWISEERFLHALNYCMLLPGPEAQQLATYIGWLLHRTVGGIVAGSLFVLPSVFVLLALSYAYAVYGTVGAAAGLLAGFKPVVVAIVVEAIFRIGRRTIRGAAHLAIAAGAFVAIYVFDVPFPLIVLGAGLIGLALGAPGSPVAPGGATSAHTRPPAARALRVLVAGLALWILPLAGLAAWRGWGSLHVQAYAFFTKAALVTFGGAYAVLAYVTQAAAGSFGWIEPAQAIDGLALAETTPGPLIMVLQFVGFMAGWNHPGEMTPAGSAILAAIVTSWTTFLPSFLFIFIGAPWIEGLRGNAHLTSALSGVTASVVGVILNLALVFGAAVIWPGGLSGGADSFMVVMSIAALFALTRMRVDVLWVVLAGGATGLVRALAQG